MKDISELKSFQKWLKLQDKVNWRHNGMAFLLNYKGVRCLALITKTYLFGNLEIGLTIRPIVASDAIEGKKPGDSEFLYFK